MKFPVVRSGVLLATHIGSPVVFIRMLAQLQSQHINQAGSPLYLLGSRSWTSNRERKDGASLQISNRNLVTNVPMVALDLPVGARFHQFWGSPGGKSQGIPTVFREGYRLLLQFRPNLTKSPTVISNYVNPHKNLRLLEALHQLVNKKCSRTSSNSKITGFLQQVIFGTQTQQPVETYLGPEHLEHLPKHKVVQNGDTRDKKNLPTGRGVGYRHKFQGHLLPHTNSQSVQEVHVFLRPGSVLPVQIPTFGLPTAPMELTVVAKEVKLMAQYLDDWLVRARSHHTCLQHTQTLVALCQELGWLVNREKSELRSTS